MFNWSKYKWVSESLTGAVCAPRKHACTRLWLVMWPEFPLQQCAAKWHTGSTTASYHQYWLTSQYGPSFAFIFASRRTWKYLRVDCNQVQVEPKVLVDKSIIRCCMLLLSLLITPGRWYYILLSFNVIHTYATALFDLRHLVTSGGGGGVFWVIPHVGNTTTYAKCSLIIQLPKMR